MEFQHFFDPNTHTLSYIVYDRLSKEALVIDPVLNFEMSSGLITTTSVKKLCHFLDEGGLSLKFILETHAHADHISGAQYLKVKYPNAVIGIGRNISKVQKTFKDIFNLNHLAIDGSQFDKLLEENEVISIGDINVQTIFTPGHTPACVSYLIGDMVFVGDAIFMPDSGTGRCDFPGGSAEDLYYSISNKLYKLPDKTKIFVGHDYQPGGRELKFSTSIGEQKRNNIQLTADTTAAGFIQFRAKRDASLSVPKLLFPSIQININAGILPAEENNGVAYLKIPIKEQL